MSDHTAIRFIRRPAASVALAMALSATAPSTLADIIDIAWTADGRFERSLSAAPGKFVEVCGQLPAGLKIRWDFEANTPLDFNVHYHVGKDVVFPSKLTAVASAKDTLDTKVDQDYCWMWTNKSSAPATVMVKLRR